MVAPHTLRGLFGLKGLVLPGRLHTGDTFMIASTVLGPLSLHAVQGRLFPFPIRPLIDLILLGVPLFLRLGLPWRIHALILLIGLYTRRPMHAMNGRDFSWLLDGPAAVGQFTRGVDGNSPG